MEFFYEAVVMGFSTSNGKRICCPQFTIKSEAGDEWRWPDFAVFGFEAPQRIIMAGVTAALDIKLLAHKTVELIANGFSKLRSRHGGDAIRSGGSEAGGLWR